MRAAEVTLSGDQRATLRSWLAAGKTEWRLAFRAQIILALADGLTNEEAAGRLATRPATVSKWRGRFERHGLAGVADAPRRGKPRHYDATDERRILAALDAPPPGGYARSNGPLLGKHLGDISKHQVWRVLREHEISLERRRSWCITDPAFAQTAADIAALYLQPPENALVLSADEKPHIQALERAQGLVEVCPTAKRSPVSTTKYKRHGTTTLFAALDVVIGLVKAVKAGHYRRRRRVEFLHFMNRVVVDHPGREIHVILDNLNTHEPKHDRWLARHKNIHFHFTPTHASWLNQVEVWFSILSSHALATASFTAPRQVRDQIDTSLPHTIRTLTPSSGPSRSSSRNSHDRHTLTYATRY